MDDCPPDRRVLMECERQAKRKWVIILLKMTEQYVRAKFLQMNRDHQSVPPGDPPVTPRCLENLSKREWERKFVHFKRRVRAYAEWLDLMK